MSGNFPTSPSTFPNLPVNIFLLTVRHRLLLLIPLVHTCPTNLSALHNVGSILVPTPISPPGTAYFNSFSSAKRDTLHIQRGSKSRCDRNDTILEKMGTHRTLPSVSFVTMPGRTSISSPTRNTPFDRVSREGKAKRRPTSHNTSTSNSSFQIIYFGTRFVHIE